MVQTHESIATAVPGALFTEGYVEADGFRIRYREAGQGEPLVSLHGAGGMKLYRSHELLAAQYRVIIFEVPGFGQSPANERSQSMPELALTMAQAVTNLGIERFNLMGNSFGGKLALWLAVQQPERVQALLLVAPAAIRPEGAVPPQALAPEELMARLYAHPERQAPLPPRGPGDQGQATGPGAPRHGAGAGRGVGEPPGGLEHPSAGGVWHAGPHDPA